MNTEKYEKILKEKLTENRFLHSINVSKQAVILAEKYDANKEKAKIAGLLHDIMKETANEKQINFLNYHNVKLNEIEKSSKKLWHAIAGAYYIKDIFKIKDQDIFNAIRYHTTGRKDMSLLEKIIFIADFTSEDREYPGVEEIKKVAYQDLEKAMIEGLSFSIKELSLNKIPIHIDTIEAYNELLLK